MNKQTIIVAGNLSDGFTFIGPFEDFDEADIWARQNLDIENWIATLEPVVEIDEDDHGNP